MICQLFHAVMRISVNLKAGTPDHLNVLVLESDDFWPVEGRERWHDNKAPGHSQLPKNAKKQRNQNDLANNKPEKAL